MPEIPDDTLVVCGIPLRCLIDYDSSRVETYGAWKARMAALEPRERKAQPAADAALAKIRERS